uniref:ASA-10: Polytomella F-ATP synthase associated subunit 10 n=1 Tax=Polytomella sp. Pringsheim 198.80 TaxID=37502 RepID=A0A5H1ZR95_9CHLO|nr:Chain 0, ASA-10: Polytomella F-ATP synthase associated subunit 10 [Polytomella sp. Pringsheim 198.80]6RD5_0 Chain 0, ASA-10: Polytomella F-ATP synthase associated subunit 10 [Polytomella sp. Pringsheim 198.80]6RD7_0 Chain 0, ASA-10: Polytomella F-ATP synthase associated subunit 10 [Polytomella sp. Pringsheim 198.80]6RD8_0 Chain 0, ASA-10: Polytomella F-ATP synthase associated subunit 10 [Polytomella sp. Pringsheim 198.80]6RD9_0 Chain 0, ASA-10: Polytomella F-ATP synthase associated subunit 1
MSYSAYFAKAGFQFPAGLSALVAGIVALNVCTGRPTKGTKEISNAEYNATPIGYLQSPDQHPTAFPKVPGMKDVHGSPHHHH